MARDFPTIEDVPVPGVQGARPVAGYDVSGYGRGAQALSQGVANFGTGVEKTANDLQSLQLYKLRNQALLAQDTIIGNVIKARQDFRHDTDYETLPGRWQQRVDDIVQKGIQQVPEGPMRTHVQARLQRTLASTHDAVQEYAFNGRKQNAHADLYDRANSLVLTIGPTEDPLHTAQVDQFNSRADEYGQQGLLTPLEVQQHKQNLALHLADGRARARGNLGPAEAAKVEQELRNSIPRGGGGGASIYPPGGWGPTDHAASVVAKAETADPSLGPKALGNISPDSNGSKSYGFMGLNSGTGSADHFVRVYGRDLGITARPGSAAFDAQWKDAATNKTAAMRDAQLRYFNEQYTSKVPAYLQRHGVSKEVAEDPRVVTYFADRAVQMGDIGSGNIDAAWNGAGGDPMRFMRNMNAIDGTPDELARNFRSAIASGVYGEAGHATRLRTRLDGALATGPAGMPPPSPAPEQPASAGQTLLPTPYVHTVAPGDTLEDIADRYGAKPQDLADENGLDPNRPIPPSVSRLTIPGKLALPEAREGGALTGGFRRRQLRFPDGSLKWMIEDPARPGILIRDPDQSGAGPATDEAPTGYTGDPLFAKLTPQHRDALIAHMQALQRQFGVQADKELKSAISDDYAAAQTSGYVKGRDYSEFEKVYGPENAPAAFQSYNRALQQNIDMYHFKDMPPEQREAIIRYHMPDPSQPGYAEGLKQIEPMMKLDEAMRKAEQQSAVKEKQDEIKDLSTRINDAIEEMRHTGRLATGIPRDEFIRILGKEDGEAAFNGFSNRLQWAHDRYDLPNRTTAEGWALAQKYEPASGQAGQKDAWERYDELRHAADKLQKELHDNPAVYMLAHNPAVRDAYAQMENATGPDAAKAAQDYASTMIAEQKRFGVEPKDMKVVTDDYAENFKTKFNETVLAGNDKQAAAMIKAERDKWGPAWNQVYRQVTAGDPVLTVVGARVKSAAGQLLVQYGKTKYVDIVKDENSAKSKDIREALDTEMASFRTSLGGNRGGIDVYNTVRGQVEKLAAIYAFQGGMDAAKAAKQATDDVLNFKYDYRDGYRIPNANDTAPAGVSPDEIQVGAAIAKVNLGGNIAGLDLAIKPHLDTFGGAYTPEQLAAETNDAKRNGRWTTNADESGLAFVYGPAGQEQVVKKADGTDLQLTWQQLGDLVKHQQASRAAGAIDFTRALRGATGYEGPFGLPEPPSVMGGTPFSAAGRPGLSGTQSGPEVTRAPSPSASPAPSSAPPSSSAPRPTTTPDQQDRIDELTDRITFQHWAANDRNLSSASRDIAAREATESMAQLRAISPEEAEMFEAGLARALHEQRRGQHAQQEAADAAAVRRGVSPYALLQTGRERGDAAAAPPAAAPAPPPPDYWPAGLFRRTEEQGEAWRDTVMERQGWLSEWNRQDRAEAEAAAARRIEEHYTTVRSRLNQFEAARHRELARRRRPE